MVGRIIQIFLFALCTVLVSTLGYHEWATEGMHCADANYDDLDGCSAHYNKVEKGWRCARYRDKNGTIANLNGAELYKCSTICGDGKVPYGSPEQCDDGNRLDGDGCNSYC